MKQGRLGAWGSTVARWVAATGVAGASASLGWACSSPAAPLGSGGQCLMTTDCVPGLVCVTPGGAAQGASKICSSNLSSVVSTEEAGTVMKGDAAAKDGAKDGAQGDGMTAGTVDGSLPGYETGAPAEGGGGADAGNGGGSAEAGD
ncbi:MAG: hypothetical protein ACRENE_07545 [Polyangiaceae bacterium]